MRSSIFHKKNFFPRNFKKGKKIIFFIGHLRTYNSIAKYIRKIVSEGNLNVLISIWHEKNVNYKQLIDDLKPLYLDIEKFRYKNTFEVFGKKCSIDKIFGRSALSTRSQIYKINRSLEIIKLLEKETNSKFEVIVKSRLDFLIISKLNFSLRNNTIFFENTVGNWAIDRSDRFFYSDRKTMIKFHNNLKKFCKSKWQNKNEYPILHKIPIQEILLKMYCDDLKIKTEPIFPLSQIWRKNSPPIFNDKFRMYIFVLRRIIKRKLLRFKT